MAIYVVSDIHGNLCALRDLIENKACIDFTKDTLYILGDMVDWGKEPLDTLFYVKDLYDKYPENVFVTLGNHELLMLSSIGRIYGTEEIWLSNNGGRTRQQLRKLYYKDLKTFQKLIAWLRSLEVIYYDGDYVFTHSNIPVNMPILTRSYYEMHRDFPEEVVNAVWTRVNTGIRHCDGTLISGHTIVTNYHSSNEIFFSNNYINIDCDAKLLGYDTNAHLGMLKIDNGEYSCFYSNAVKI